jgi:hypothetical protein
MLAKLGVLAVCLLALAACQGNEAQIEEQEAIALSIEEFNADQEIYEGKLLAVSGTVEHVCKHGGKRMFIMGEDPEQRVKIETTDDVGPFAMELEGSDVAVEGIVQVLKVDHAYLDNWEEEVRLNFEEQKSEESHVECEHDSEHEGEDEHKGEDTHAGEEDDHHHHSSLEETLKQIESLRQKLAESEKGYLGFYSLECKSYKELKQ